MEAEDLTSYLSDLVERILHAIQHDRATYDMRRFGITALGSMITASKTNFAPYFEKTYTLLNNLLKSNHE